MMLPMFGHKTKGGGVVLHISMYMYNPTLIMLIESSYTLAALKFEDFSLTFQDQIINIQGPMMNI